MNEASLLRRYPAVRTRNAEELRHWLAPALAVNSLDMPDGGRGFDSEVNHCELPSLGLTYARYGSPLTARLSQNDFFIQGLPITGAGEVSWNGRTALVGIEVGGVAGGPGSEGKFTYGENFSHLMVKFAPAALTQKLSALIGEALDPPLRLDAAPASNPVYLAGQMRLTRFLAAELDRADGALPPIVLAEIEQSIIVAYLMASGHNYSHRLEGSPRSVAPWQVRRATEYIESHWDQAISIEALSRVTQTSVRSLFHLFKRTHGVSPMVFVRRVRLQRAKTMLSHPLADTSVTSVGFLCGFSNMGHFARYYFGAFGELPSDTLKAHR